MHFRHFLMTGLMVGAALFFPDGAFAEKNEIRGQEQKAERVSVQPVTKAVPAHVPDKIESAPSIIETDSSITPSVVDSNKPDAVLKNLPDQAKANVQPAEKKVEKVTGLEKAATVQEKTKELAANKSTPKKMVDDAVFNSSHKSEAVEKNKAAEMSRLEQNTEPSNEKILESFVPSLSNHGKAPDNKEEMPKVNQITNQTQRTSSTGGKTNDRTSQGLGTLSLMDKMFEWTTYVNVLHEHLYFSRQEFLIHQWVNAPPLPPPLTASYYKNVTRS